MGPLLRQSLRLSLSQVAIGACSLFYFLSLPAQAEPESPFSEKAEFVRYAEKLRESVLQSLEPEVRVPSSGSLLGQTSRLAPGTGTGTGSLGRYPWKNKIVTTIFWVGESASVNNPVPVSYTHLTLPTIYPV